MRKRYSTAGGHGRRAARRVWLSILLGLVVFPAAGWGQYVPAARRPFADAYAKEHPERIRTYDLEHVLLKLRLDEQLQSVAGTSTLSLRPLRPGLETVEVDSVELCIASVTLPDGEELPFELDGEKLRIHLLQPADPEDLITLTIAYDGKPRKGLYFFQPDRGYPERRPQIWSQGEMDDSRFWFPVYDFPNDRATTEGFYTVRSDFTVISNGRLMGVTEDSTLGTKTYHWKQDVPHSTYLVSVVAGQFEKYTGRQGDVPLEYYVPPGTGRDKTMRTFSETPAALRFFEERIGLPYPYAKYAQTAVQEFTFGGMENISATTLTDRTLHEAASEPQSSSIDLVTHELAHQWFGDLLTCRDWAHLWLNEGFATFWAAVYREHRFGWDEYLNEVREDRERYISEDRQRYRRPLVTSYYADPVDLFDRTTYQKGFLVLDMLRYLLGDERFFEAIRHYAATYQNQTVVTDDLRKAIEESTGEELGWFFEQWVYQAGYPELSVTQEWNESAKQVRLVIEQTQTLDAMTPLFRMPVQVEFTATRMKKTALLDVSRQRQEYTFALAEKPLMTRFDPDGRVLMTVRFRKPTAELLYQLEHDPSIVGRIRAAQRLASASGDRREIVRALRERLARDSFWAVSAAAAEALGEMRTEEAREALAEGLKNRDPRVRQAAVRALGRFFRDPEADELARKVYESDRSPVTTAEAAYAVGRIQGQGAREFLERALHRDSDQDVVRRFALAGLRDLRDRQAWDIAAEWAQYGKPTLTRVVAIEAFSRLGPREEKTAELLIALLDDPNVFVRQRAIQELGQGRFQGAREALTRMAQREVHSTTRRAVQRALQRLGSAVRAGASRERTPARKSGGPVLPADPAARGRETALLVP